MEYNLINETNVNKKTVWIQITISFLLSYMSFWELSTYSTLSEKGDQECPGHDFLMSRSAVHYVSFKSEA